MAENRAEYGDMGTINVIKYEPMMHSVKAWKVALSCYKQVQKPQNFKIFPMDFLPSVCVNSQKYKPGVR